ncbi:MAG: L-2-hydroxyglutarate oxidase [Thermomicrobiales bacterium]|nr:L-2-hydroxyglutarate oxidase [Thermomicrobiales bacterium]
MADFDLAVIGGGIVGLSTAMQMQERFPGISVAVLEKEPALATHQTGRNSGVIHAGVYYQPGSLKARFCREGVKATIRFCEERDIPYEQCGKLLVATDEEELPRMAALYDRAIENGIVMERLDKAEVARREPHIRSVGAIYSPTTGIVDYGRIARAMADVVRERGGEVMTSSEVIHIDETPADVALETGRQRVRAKQVIAAAGLQADRIARMCGVDLDFRIVPFRGEYYRLGADKNDIVNHLIYPIPDPALPFLGVHLTRMIGGYVTVGPNAVLAFAREGYGFGDVDLRDMGEMLRFPGFRKVIKANLKSGMLEIANSLLKSRYLALCQRYCPELTLDDLTPYRAGVRAQAVLADGTMVHDFLIGETGRTIHVLNAPSPAATSAIPIGKHIVGLAEAKFALKAA